jgi:hypothetical protein
MRKGTKVRTRTLVRDRIRIYFNTYDRCVVICIYLAFVAWRKFLFALVRKGFRISFKIRYSNVGAGQRRLLASRFVRTLV